MVTNLDHEANIGPWRALAPHGVRVREWAMDPATARLEPEGLARLLGARTRLVCFTHCANVVGAFHDVAAITRLAHDAGAWVCVDGVAYAPHRRVDVAAWDVDFYLVSAYKVFGPHVGLLYGKRERLLEMRGQSHDFVAEDDIPYKLEPGGVAHELAAGLPGILEHLEALGERQAPEVGLGAGTPDVEDGPRVRLARAFDRIAAHEEALVAPLLKWLDEHPEIRLIGPASPDRALRAPTVAFAVGGRRASEIPPRLEAHHIAARWGHFYAPRAIHALGLAERDGIVRISLAHYNTAEEVDRAMAALGEIV